MRALAPAAPLRCLKCFGVAIAVSTKNADVRYMFCYVLGIGGNLAFLYFKLARSWLDIVSDYDFLSILQPFCNVKESSSLIVPHISC